MKLNKETIKYVLFGIGCLLIFGFGEIARVFEPLYENIYYGTLNNMFYNIIRAIIWVIGIVIVIVLSKKFLSFNPLGSKQESKKEELPMKNLLILTLIVTVCIAIASGLVGWQVKILADLGERYTGLMLGMSAVKWGCSLIKIAVVIMMLNFFQVGVEKSFPNLNNIPWGGILLMLTFGIYELIMKETNLPLLYLLFTVVYGEIHLLTHRNTIKSFLLIYFIYLL